MINKKKNFDMNFLNTEEKKITNKFFKNSYIIKLNENKSSLEYIADLLNKNIERSSEEIKNERMEICRSCPFFIKITTQCSKCGCVMEAKTRLAEASCPVNKWGPV